MKYFILLALSSQLIAQTGYKTNFFSSRGLLRSTLENMKNTIVEESIVLSARVTLPIFLTQLDLRKDVRDRLLHRLYDKKFNDDIVPFLLNAKDMYYKKQSQKDLSFDQVLRANQATLASIPGIEHELFKFSPDLKEKDNSAKKKTPNLLYFCKLVLEMYDLLYIKNSDTQNLDLDTQKNIKLIFEDLLTKLAPAFHEDPNIEEAVDNLLGSDEKKMTVANSAAKFITQLIDHHRVIIKNEHRIKESYKQLYSNKWQEFKDEKNNDLITLLKSMEHKRYAVQFVVDGMQGNLIKGLIGKNPQFIKQINSDHLNQNSFKPLGEETTPIKNTLNRFLPLLAKNQYSGSSYLPFFKKTFNEYHATWTEQGVSTTPTISVRNLPIAMTGVDVVGKESTSLPNFHYIDRLGVDRDDKKQRAYYFFGNDALLLSDITQRHGMKTMFERLAKEGMLGLACNTNYDKGAFKSYDAFLNLSVGEKSRDFGEMNCLAELRERMENEKKLALLKQDLLDQISDYQNPASIPLWKNISQWKDEKDIKIIIELIAKLEPKALPEYVQIYIPWPDHFAHFNGPFSDSQLSPSGEYNRLDYWMGKVDSLYRNAGIYSKTMLGASGDHGLAPIYFIQNPEKTVIEKFQKDSGIKLKYKKISSDEGEGPKLNNEKNPETMRGYDVVIASTAGGNFMMDFFVDQNENWQRQPTLSEIKKLKTLSGQVIDMEKIITDYLPNSLEYMVTRNTATNYNFSDISLSAKRNNIFYRERIIRKMKKAFYQKSQGDLLGLSEPVKYKTLTNSDIQNKRELTLKCLQNAQLSDESTWCHEDEWRELFRLTNKPDAVNQLAHLYDSDKAGTVNLFPLFGNGYNTKVPGRHAGEHFHEKDAIVMIWGGAVAKSHVLYNAVVGQVAPTLYEYLTGKSNNGFGFSSLFE